MEIKRFDKLFEEKTQKCKCGKDVTRHADNLEDKTEPMCDDCYKKWWLSKYTSTEDFTVKSTPAKKIKKKK